MLKLIAIIIIAFYAIKFLNKILIIIQKIQEDRETQAVLDRAIARREARATIQRISDELKAQYQKEKVKKFAEKSIKYNEKKGY